jgi:NAD(P)H-dependent flavin oxidoreductase YrpB (nitropropane dioxygenase family)
MRAQRADIAVNFAGQGLGLIHEVKTAAEVLQDLVRGAERALREAPTRTLR